MTKPIMVIATILAATAATGCSGLQQAMGLTKSSPDEFRIVTRAPLTLPPDYSLRPPRPGEPRPQELEPSAEARTALFGQDTGRGASAGERALVAGAGASTVDPEIRDVVDFEGQNVVRRSEPFVDRLLAFQGQEAAQTPQSDAAAEQRRLEEEEAIRRATGGGDVVIQRERGGFKLPGT
ncbi:MAG: DUF3035 domain-containing protein [Hyphomonadaceae bacterium]|nr:DUF3035 domain-containing protein [Hyphomonadaceae bacterium]